MKSTARTASSIIERLIMQTRYEFYKSLSEGDVITSAGCKTSKGIETTLSNNRLHHQDWGKWARVTYVGTSELAKENDGKERIGIRMEGIDPSVHDCFIHVATKGANEAPEARKATKTERKVFLKEYVRTRAEIVEHKKKEIEEEKKRMAAQMRSINKIAAEEKLDVQKLLKKKGKK